MTDSISFAPSTNSEDFLTHIRKKLAVGQQGFCIVNNTALDPRSFMEFLHRNLAPSLSVSQQRGTTFTYDEVKDRGDQMEKKGALLSSSNQFFPLHTDGCFLERPPDLVALYCVENSVTGGESSLLTVDRLLAQLPEGYLQQLLTQPFSFYSKEFRILEKKGAHYLMRFHERELLESCVPDRLEKCREAIRPLVTILQNPAYLTKVKLMPHQCLLVNNRTCLHGRFAFEAGSQRIFYRSRHYVIGEEAE